MSRSQVVSLATGLSTSLMLTLLAALWWLSTSHAVGNVYCIMPPGEATGPLPIALKGGRLTIKCESRLYP
jgi:hypothetical protein